MTKAELIEQRVQQLIAQNWDRASAQADAERTYANVEDEASPAVEAAPKRAAKKPKAEVVTEAAEAVEEGKSEE